LRLRHALVTIDHLAVAIVGVRMVGVWLRGLVVGAALAAAPTVAETVKGRADIAGVSTIVELQTGSDEAVLRHRPADNSVGWTRYPIRVVDDAVPILPDMRLAFLWPALEQGAGADLTGLRDRSLASTRAAWAARKPGLAGKTVPELSVRPPVLAAMQYAAALASAGSQREAADLLESQIAAIDLKRERDAVEISMLAAIAASYRRADDDPQSAIRLLRSATERLGTSPYALNTQLSLAALLAETGAFHQALDIGDAARARFQGTLPKGTAVANALPQFDWVRACALAGLGRLEEARATMAAVEQAVQVDARRVRLPQVRDHEYRGHVCMGNADALAAAWKRDAAGPSIGSVTFTLAQPGARLWREAEPVLSAARGQFGLPAPIGALPDRYRPALRNWR
jgi:hypothetical protein